jgi:DNA-binding NarL/FixJ family response regulator
MQQNIDLVLVGDRSSQNLFDVMATLKGIRPNLHIIVIGSGMEDEAILKAIAFGAKGYVDVAAVWAPRRVLSAFVERVSQSPGRFFPAGRTAFTAREQEVLELLVGRRPNKEIGAALGVEERTVKAHIAKLMRKTSVHNRLALSVHAVTHSLVSSSSNPNRLAVDTVGYWRRAADLRLGGRRSGAGSGAAPFRFAQSRCGGHIPMPHELASHPSHGSEEPAELLCVSEIVGDS